MSNETKSSSLSNMDGDPEKFDWNHWVDKVAELLYLKADSERKTIETFEQSLLLCHDIAKEKSEAYLDKCISELMEKLHSELILRRRSADAFERGSQFCTEFVDSESCPYCFMDQLLKMALEYL